MPVYEYACEKCGHEFEAQQRITDDPIKTCPVCKARKVKRLISQTSFVLKGGGWYADLYSSKGKSDRPEAKGEGSAKSDRQLERSEPQRECLGAGAECVPGADLQVRPQTRELLARLRIVGS